MSMGDNPETCHILPAVVSNPQAQVFNSHSSLQDYHLLHLSYLSENDAPAWPQYATRFACFSVSYRDVLGGNEQDQCSTPIRWGGARAERAPSARMRAAEHPIIIAETRALMYRRT